MVSGLVIYLVFDVKVTEGGEGIVSDGLIGSLLSSL